MTEKTPQTVENTFSHIEDPRQQHKIIHPLENIIFIVFCGVLCNAEDFVEIELFGNSEKEWLSKYLDLSNGIPSHDTLGRTLGLLNEAILQECFAAWMTFLCGKVSGQIAVDGKVLRGTGSKAKLGKDAFVMVTAFAVEHGLTLGQQSVASKSNEITAIPHLINMLDLEACVITTDAMGCQIEIVEKIIEKKGDYVIALKKNQGNLYDDTVNMFEYLLRENAQDLAYCQTTNKGHGRVEVRECWTYSFHAYDAHFRTLAKWKGIEKAVMVKSKRVTGDKVETKLRFFISSLKVDAATHLTYVRSHWQIENGAHWVLDVALKEDAHQLKNGQAAKNLSVLRQMIRNLLKLDKSKGSIKGKMKQCGWNLNKREEILSKIFLLE